MQSRRGFLKGSIFAGMGCTALVVFVGDHNDGLKSEMTAIQNEELFSIR